MSATKHTDKPVLVFQSHTHQLFGGAELSLLALLKDSVERGYETHVIVPDTGDFALAAKKTGATIHIVRSYWWTTNGRNESLPYINLRAIKKTRTLLRRLQPFACITNTVVSPWLACAAYAEGFAHIWVIREYGDTDHGLTFWMTKKAVGRAVSTMSAKIFTNSEVLKEHYAILTGRKDIGTITPFVEKPAPGSKASPFEPDALKLVCVGNLSEGKGQMDAARAVKKIKDSGRKVQLFLVGLAAEVSYLEKIRTFVEENDLQNEIIFAGYQKNPADYVAHADINLVCSRTETFGRVTIESLLLGTPVIGTDSANTAKLLGGKKELLYKFGDSDELAAKILSFAGKPATLKNTVAPLQKAIKQKYSPENAHANFWAYVDNLEPGRPKPLGDYKPLYKELQKQQDAENRKGLARKWAGRAYKFARRTAGKVKRDISARIKQ